ncbi:MAG: response regulator transcription factor [Sarcina sp.]
MKLLVFCKIKLFSLGLVAILKNISTVKTLKLTDNLLSLKDVKEETTVIVVFEENNNDLIKDIEELSKNNHVNILIIDLIGSRKYIEELMKFPIKSYLLSTSSLEDVEFALNKINNNEKYFQDSILEIMLNSKKEKLREVSSPSLSKREKEILEKLSLGESNIEISLGLHISENTVKKHISNIFQKTNCKDRVQAALLAQKIL